MGASHANWELVSTKDLPFFGFCGGILVWWHHIQAHLTGSFGFEDICLVREGDFGSAAIHTYQ